MSWIQRRIDLFRASGLLTRTLLTTFALLLSSSAVLATVSFAAVSATRAVFPPASAATISSATPAEVAEVSLDSTAVPRKPTKSATAPRTAPREALAAAPTAGDGDAEASPRAKLQGRGGSPLAPATLRPKLLADSPGKPGEMPQARPGEPNE